MEADEVNVIAFPVLGDREQRVTAFEAAFTSEIVRYLLKRYFLDRIHNDVAVVHRIFVAGLHSRRLPDAHAAADASALNAVTQLFREHHALEVAAHAP